MGGPHEFQKEPSQSSSGLKKRKGKKPRDLTCVEEPSLNSISEDQTIEELCSALGTEVSLGSIHSERNEGNISRMKKKLSKWSKSSLHSKKSKGSDSMVDLNEKIMHDTERRISNLTKSPKVSNQSVLSNPQKFHVVYKK